MNYDDIPQNCSPHHLTDRVLLEIDLLLARAEIFERDVESILMKETPQMRTQTIKSLQEVDILTQSLQCIAIVLKAVQQSMSEEKILALPEIVSRVPLRDMAMRLSGAAHEEVSHTFTEF
ncbi:MAG: hypothetical protein ACKVKF_14590 [Rhodobacterales bacterium]|uniref:hypothetical protein n=1 Tax=Puniceibacterium antarcticum TaxID=1206336 RepID=UPI00117B03BA|nr:hypothetical protein [Puniceibacterium antarcticum]